MSVILYSYFRSSCSWRIRIALNLKNIAYEYRAVNLLKDEQYSEEHLQRNAIGSVPVLFIDNVHLAQSVAIMEYLEETRPVGHKLLPTDPKKRHKVRQLTEMIASDIQPIQNLRVLKKHGLEHRKEWGSWIVNLGFKALEKEMQHCAGKYCVGDEVTMADVCLVPQYYNAKRFDVDLTQYPLISRVVMALEDLPAFQQAHPQLQPDCPPEERIP
jgi:maleylacetoacetate isomerase